MIPTSYGSPPAGTGAARGAHELCFPSNQAGNHPLMIQVLAGASSRKSRAAGAFRDWKAKRPDLWPFH